MTLNSLDRCDKCGAQAYFTWIKVLSEDDGAPVELLFCAHHSGRNLPALRDQGFEIAVDDSAQLTAKPTVPESV